VKLNDIPLKDRHQFLGRFIAQTQENLDKAKEQLDKAKQQLAEALVQHDVYKTAGFDTTKTENAVKAKESAVALLQQDIERLGKELDAFLAYQVKLSS